MPNLMIDPAGAQPLIETPAVSPRKDGELVADPGFAAIFAMAMGLSLTGSLPAPTPGAGQSPVAAGGLTAAVGGLTAAAGGLTAAVGGLTAAVAAGAARSTGPGAARGTATAAAGAVAAAGANPAATMPGGLLPTSAPVAAPPVTPAPAGAAPAAPPHVQTGKPEGQLMPGLALASAPELAVNQPDAAGQLLPNQVQAPPNQAQASPNHVQVLLNEVQAPSNQVQAPPTQVQAPPNQVEALPNQVQAPSNQVQAPTNQVQPPPTQVQALPKQIQPPPDQAQAPPDQVLTPTQQVAANQLVGSGQPLKVNRQPVPPTAAPDREQEQELAPPPIVQGGSHGLRLAAEFAPAKTDAAAAPAGPPQSIDQVMERVAQVVTRAQDGTYTLTLRLHPEQLGEVRLHLVVAGREIQTLMAVQNPAAQQALTRGGEQLRQSLDQAGYALTGFQVSTGEGGGSAEGRQQARDFQAPGHGRPAAHNAPAGPAAATVQPRIPLRPGGLDTMA